MIEIDRVWYKINIDEGKRLREIYNGLDYKEEAFVV